MANSRQSSNGHTSQSPIDKATGKPICIGYNRGNCSPVSISPPAFSSALTFSEWESELKDDPDKEFLLEGIRDGFHIVSPESRFQPAHVANYKSATVSSRQQVEKQLRSELIDGHYIITPTKPTIVSALGAIPKPNSADVRLIHDCSQPEGRAVNDYAPHDSFQYQTIDDAVNLVTPGCYLSKVDLKSAYRSVKIHPSNYPATGLQWFFNEKDNPTYMTDTRLPFGARRAPYIFNRLTQSVRRMMARRGYDAMVVYLDDFLIIAQTYELCELALNTILRLLRRLGFRIAWGKVVGPSQKLTFLGIDIDTVHQTLQLPSPKLAEFLSTMHDFSKRKRASRRQLQCLAGKLAWACHVIKGGRTFLRRVLDDIYTLNKSSHKILLSHEFQLDINWWLKYLAYFNGTHKFIDPRPITDVHMDASTEASGIFYRGDWQYTQWGLDWPEASTLHINHKEVLSVVLASRRWAPRWRNCTVLIHTDSMVALANINKGTSRHRLVMGVLRELFWLSVCYNFNISAIHVPGKLNHIPDAISRLHQPGQYARLCGLLAPFQNRTTHFTSTPSLQQHMSHASFCHLLPQILNWKGWNKNLMWKLPCIEETPLQPQLNPHTPPTVVPTSPSAFNLDTLQSQ
uniref:Uncharacterized protein LOC102805774 n=1 Tax=Saccoglossus kowalevskii TaxID=10224 RepID=A0ABM0MIL9_SACKO|nr:PREDICTED: uncharacterized protein LOC102805774 [Saccoglossus kowalevskii]